MNEKRMALVRVLEERRQSLPRTARQFLTSLLADEGLLGSMCFCHQSERGRLRNSVLIATDDVACWGVLLGNRDEGGAAARSRLALEGLDLSIPELLERLRPLPVWFLALDAAFAPLSAGDAVRVEETVYRMAATPARLLRRRALLDQADAALDAGDRDAWARLQTLLSETEAD